LVLSARGKEGRFNRQDPEAAKVGGEEGFKSKFKMQNEGWEDKRLTVKALRMARGRGRGKSGRESLPDAGSYCSWQDRKLPEKRLSGKKIK
jgi:hypothetical protein